MTIWLALWALVALLESGLYIAVGRNILSNRVLRAFAGGVVAVAVIATAIVLLLVHWQVWLLPAFLTPYRIINIARVVRYQLLPPRLRAVSLRAHIWLVLAQILLSLLSYSLLSLPVTQIAGIFVAVQLFVVLILLRSTTQTWEYARVPSGTKHYTDRELPSVSVLIPARDETESLEQCLASLVQSNYPKLEILVLDDCSPNRRTPEIIRAFAHDGVRFVQGTEPEDNWVAKNHASEQLRSEASGELLLFCSADVLFEATTIRSMVESLLNDNNDMLSVLPSRSNESRRHLSLLEPMRYYWELCLPRRLFKRPPVLSTCWLIRAKSLEDFGGFSGYKQSMTPETHFARRAVISGKYSFLRSSGDMVVYNTKNPESQYDTTVRLRYPQLHRRLELVALTSIFELFFLAGPFIGLLLAPLLPNSLAYIFSWLAVVAATEVMYYYVAVETRLNTTLMAVLTAPLAILVDIYMLHISLLKYEFGEVAWKGRNVCIPVMRVEARLPELPKR